MPPSSVTVSGNLTLGGAPVSDGLIALTVVQGTFQKTIRPLLFRTLSTGTVPAQNWPINIISVQTLKPSNDTFIPASTFQRPSSQSAIGPIFNITLRNVNITYPATLYLTLTVFDSAQVAIDTRTWPMSFSVSNSTVSYITDAMYLNSWVALGNATAYVCVFDNVPPFTYYPLCPESSVHFQVVSGGGSSSSSQPATSAPKNGTFNFTFRINYHMISASAYPPWGNYTARVSSSYKGNQAVNSYTFWVRIPSDLNGDGVVDIGDASIIGINWHKKVPPANPAADPNEDGIVDISDAAMVGLYWGKTEHY